MTLCTSNAGLRLRLQQQQACRSVVYRESVPTAVGIPSYIAGACGGAFTGFTCSVYLSMALNLISPRRCAVAVRMRFAPFASLGLGLARAALSFELFIIENHKIVREDRTVYLGAFSENKVVKLYPPPVHASTSLMPSPANAPYGLH